MELKLLNHSSCLIYSIHNLGHGHVHINYSALNNILMDHI